MNAVPRQHEAQLSQAMAGIRDQEVKVEVTGPRTVIAGVSRRVPPAHHQRQRRGRGCENLRAGHR